MNEETTYRVFEINQKIKEILETSFPQSIWVKGEIASFDRQAKQRNIFFQLQEKDKIHNRLLATVDCFLGETAKPLLRKRLIEGGVVQQLKGGMDGLEVRLKVKLSVYVPGGKYHLMVEDIDPAFTLGQIEQNRKRIIEFLKRNNLLEKNKKETFLPLVVQKIGLTTKEGSQAYFDFLKKLEDSHFSFLVSFYQASVQGRRLEPDILKALNYFHEHSEEIDVVVIVRGGGARSDLGWFDNQKIAEAIANFPKPVLTGIGHKKDVSITDLVAYLAASTPSSLADFLTARNEGYLRKLEKSMREIRLSALNLLRWHQQTVKNLRSAIQANAQRSSQVAFQKLFFFQKEIRQISLRSLKNEIRKISEAKEKILAFARESIRRNKNQLKGYQENIALLDPINILKRGFSLATINGKIVKGIEGIKIGAIVWTHFQKGKIKSQVQDVKKGK